MGHTLTLETRAVKAASRQWKELSPEVQRMISMRTLFVHRTAPLIKDLVFTRLPEENHRVFTGLRACESQAQPFFDNLFGLGKDA